VVKAAFSDAVLKEGYNSDLISLGDDAVAVLRVRQHEPAKRLPFSAVRSRILTTLKQAQAVALAHKMADRLLKTVDATHTLQQRMTARGFAWHVVKRANRQASGVDPVILTRLFAISPQLAGRPAGQVGVATDNGDYVLIQLVAVHPGHPEALTTKQAAAYRRLMRLGLGALNERLYRQSAINRAKIEQTEGKRVALF
jgi:peptidyl-prolyl cis-trans isomerase D